MRTRDTTRCDPLAGCPCAPGCSDRPGAPAGRRSAAHGDRDGFTAATHGASRAFGTRRIGCVHAAGCSRARSPWCRMRSDTHRSASVPARAGRARAPSTTQIVGRSSQRSLAWVAFLLWASPCAHTAAPAARGADTPYAACVRGSVAR